MSRRRSHGLRGQGRPALASRLGKASKHRNLKAHPDPSLRHDILNLASVGPDDSTNVDESAEDYSCGHSSVDNPVVSAQCPSMTCPYRASVGRSDIEFFQLEGNDFGTQTVLSIPPCASGDYLQCLPSLALPARPVRTKLVASCASDQSDLVLDEQPVSMSDVSHLVCHLELEEDQADSTVPFEINMTIIAGGARNEAELKKATAIRDLVQVDFAASEKELVEIATNDLVYDLALDEQPVSMSDVSHLVYYPEHVEV